MNNIFYVNTNWFFNMDNNNFRTIINFTFSFSIMRLILKVLLLFKNCTTVKYLKIHTQTQKKKIIFSFTLKNQTIHLFLS